MLRGASSNAQEHASPPVPDQQRFSKGLQVCSIRRDGRCRRRGNPEKETRLPISAAAKGARMGPPSSRPWSRPLKSAPVRRTGAS